MSKLSHCLADVWGWSFAADPCLSRPCAEPCQASAAVSPKPDSGYRQTVDWLTETPCMPYAHFSYTRNPCIRSMDVSLDGFLDFWVIGFNLKLGKSEIEAASRRAQSTSSCFAAVRVWHSCPGATHAGPPGTSPNQSHGRCNLRSEPRCAHRSPTSKQSFELSRTHRRREAHGRGIRLCPCTLLAGHMGGICQPEFAYS